MNPDSPFNILVVDDHALVREAFTSLLRTHFLQATVASAGSCADAMAEARNRRFHIALLDIELGDRSGMELTTELRTLPEPPLIIAVSMHEEETFVKRTLQLGARSYVAKDAPPIELFEAIRATMAGRSYISHALAQKLFNHSIHKSSFPGPVHERLSNRELEVLIQLARGKSLKQVALDLSLSPRTVAVHKHNLCRKTGLKGTVEILRYCQSNGLA
ncbi:response regulator transcription factor [Prosthecobacter sp.]|uniref:response regulator transcription factor n=1 Tax=Prosthecobacter sp. TaxID=1965333 RepID=UPI001DDCB854|nr:response regulator transcription factor [Prosthecobacter sp.]MCB1278010.1 response regulator transcription factor [Prosthecobacter sp.]